MANNNNNIGKTKRSTDSMIDDAIAQQNDWLNQRRTFTRRFLKSLNVFLHDKNNVNEKQTKKKEENKPKNHGGVLREYWFPLLCTLLVILVAIWVIFIKIGTPKSVVTFNTNNNTTTTVAQKTEPTPAKEIKPIEFPKEPMFDIVRFKSDGNIIIAGRWAPNKAISVLINNKLVATEQTNADGEFVYSPTNKLKPGNYTISLIGANPTTKSIDKVFLYVSESGANNSVSLLMTPDGSRILQTPGFLMDGDLRVSKIDYLDTGRIVVTGEGLPRLRVSLSLDDKYIGFARVSDFHNFGLGADAGELKPGQEYKLSVRMHDGDGQTISKIEHKFVMPEMTGDRDTFYTVRRGDCLWIIARNFLRRGVLFSIIADRNHIKNPDLIYTNQSLQIPTKKK